jgi:predicted negative regulator of RcsB-dependent stress response
MLWAVGSAVVALAAWFDWMYWREKRVEKRENPPQTADKSKQR